MHENKHATSLTLNPLTIVSIYTIAGFLWILFSSRLASLLAKDLSTVSFIEIAKGVAFVLLTSALLYWLLSRYASRIRESEAKLLSLNRLYVFMTQTNQLIVRADSQNHLFSEICRLAVDVGAFSSAQIEAVEDDGKTVNIASYGKDASPANASSTKEDSRDSDEPPIVIAIQRGGKVAFLLHLTCKEGPCCDPSMLSILHEIARDVGFYLDAIDQEELRNLAEARSRQNEGLLKAVVESLPVGVWIADSRGNIVMGNPEGKRIWGGAKYIGTENFDQYKGWWAETGEKIGAEEWGMSRAIKGGETSINELIEIEAFDGIRRTLLHSCFPIHDDLGKVRGAVAVNQDITPLKEAENEIRESEKRYRYLFQNNPQPMWVYDVDTLRFLMVNDAAVAHYGYSQDEFLNMSIKDIRPPEDIPALLDNVAKIRHGMQKAGIWRHIRKDGSVILVEISSHTMIFNEKRSELVLSNDVTERIKAQEQLSALAEQLEQRVLERTKALEEANKELEAFSFSISHDLRAPLVIIEGYCSALQEDYGEQLPAQGLKYLERLQIASQRMSQMIEALLNLSRFTRGTMHREIVSLSELAREVEADLKKMWEDRHVVFTVNEDMVAYADPKLIRIVLANLLSNAWKYTSKRQPARVEFGKREEGDEVVFYVRDNGAGYDMSYAEKLFSPFHRLHRQEDFEGTGIGLATVQRIIHRHGGRIWAEGKTGEGATFYFTLGQK